MFSHGLMLPVISLYWDQPINLRNHIPSHLILSFPGKVEEQPHPWDGLFLEAEDPPTEFSKIMDSNRERRNSGGKKGNWLALFFSFLHFPHSSNEHNDRCVSYVTYQHRILLSFFHSLSDVEWMKLPGKPVRPPAVEEAPPEEAETVHESRPSRASPPKQLDEKTLARIALSVQKYEQQTWERLHMEQEAM